MTIASKSGGLILKDSKLATNCGCCICSPDTRKLRITLDNLPSDCARRDHTPFASFYLREYSDFNNCSINLFRVSSTELQGYAFRSDVCYFAGYLPLAINSSFLGCNSGHVRLVLDLQNDTLTLLLSYLSSIQVWLEPEAGKSFADLPYSGGVVVRDFSVTNPLWVADCPAEKWSNVTVTIDTEEPTFKPFICPHENNEPDLWGSTFNNNRRISACESPADLHPSATQPGISVQYGDCEACDPNTFTKVPSVAPFYVAGYDDLNLAINFSGVGITNPTFQSGFQTYTLPEPQRTMPGYQSLSGTYALRYTSASELYAPFGPPADGGYLPDCGWVARFTGAQMGLFDFSVPGYQLWINPLAPDTSIGRVGAAMSIAVCPVGWYYQRTVNNGVSSYTRTPCEAGKNAFQIRLALSTLGGANNLLVYEPCQQRACGEAPTISLNETIYGNMLAFYPPAQSLPGNFSVTLSSV